MSQPPLFEHEPESACWTSALDGLPLHAATGPGWSAVALSGLDALLSDHAHCEKKAASTALTLIAKCPSHEPLVHGMLALAHEELLHFRQVHDLLRKRGGRLAVPSADRYVRELRTRGFRLKGGLGPVTDLLLLSSLIEARSCERLRLLAEGLRRGEGDLPPDERLALRTFYGRLADAEARHWELFTDLAGQVSEPERVRRRLEQFAILEASVIATLPHEARMH